MSLQDLTQAYQTHIGNDPRKDIPFMAGAAGLGTYVAARPLLSLLAQGAGTLGGPAAQQAVQDYMAPNGDIEGGRRRLAVIAALVGALYGTAKHADWKGNLKGSLTEPNYWENHPEAAKAYETVKPVRDDIAATSMDIPLQKSAWGSDEGYMHPFHQENIQTHKAIGIVREDPYLLQDNRSKITSLIADSDNKGWTSSANLTNSALKAGVDFSTAYIFSTGLSKIVKLPDPLANRVATLGGVSAAVLGSGILKQL